MKRLGAAKQLAQERCAREPHEDLHLENSACNCEDYLRHTYPCKHILSCWIDHEGALNIPNDSVLAPWISIDPFDQDDNPNDLSENVSTTCTSTYDDPSNSEVINAHSLSEVPKTTDIQLSLHKLRNCLDQLKSWSYITTSKESVNAVLEQLGSIVTTHLTSNSVTHSDGLVLDPSKKRRITLASGNLSVKKSRRNHGRVGLVADYTVKTLAECTGSKNVGSDTAYSSSALSRGRKILQAARKRSVVSVR